MQKDNTFRLRGFEVVAPALVQAAKVLKLVSALSFAMEYWQLLALSLSLSLFPSPPSLSLSLSLSFPLPPPCLSLSLSLSLPL